MVTLSCPIFFKGAHECASIFDEAYSLAGISQALFQSIQKSGDLTKEAGAAAEGRGGCKVRHPARIETSVRLQKVLAILSDKEWHSTYEIMQMTQLCAVGSAISELRANGFIVDCRLGKEIGGDKYYEYQIQGTEAVAGNPSPIGQAEHSTCMRHVEAVAPDIITSPGRQASKPASRAPIIQEALF